MLNASNASLIYAFLGFVIQLQLFDNTSEKQFTSCTHEDKMGVYVSQLQL